jgi:hypothetical protein
MALFGPSPAERERRRLRVLEGHAGMPAREALVRRDQGRYIEPEYEPPLRNPWRPAPETPTPLPQRRMHFARPAKGFAQMTDAEIEDFAKQFMLGMTRQVGG